MENTSINPDNISNQQWLDAMSDAADHITKKFKYKLPQAGPFSEQVLGMKAVEYFPLEAFDLLYSGEKEIEPDKSLEDQMVNLVDKLMNNHKQRRRIRTVPFNDLIHDVEVDNSDDQIHIVYEMAEMAADGDPDLLDFLDAMSCCNSYEEISKELNITIKDVYNLQRKLKRRLQKCKNFNDEKRLSNRKIKRA